MIAALFVARGGVYYGLDDVDPWDEERDARLYSGPYPVVAHPPCARWCRLAGLVEARGGRKRGEDAGCFASALTSVRRWGGVLEHPAYSDAWQAHGLPWPSRHGWQRDIHGGWCTHVEQAHYGHRARKATWLYACGVSTLPEIKWGPSESTAWCSWAGKSRMRDRERGRVVERLGHRERSATPLAFRDVLLAIARGVDSAHGT